MRISVNIWNVFTVEDKDPDCIFSKPSTNTHSAFRDSMICFPKYNAVDPVEQLLLTLYTGIPVIPISYKALWPHVESPKILL